MFEEENHLDNLKRIELIDLNTKNNRLSSSIFIQSRPVQNTTNYSLTSFKDDKVILAGGRKCNFQEATCVLAAAYLGSLNDNEDDLIWSKLPNFSKARYCHTSFNLNNKFYIIGGLDLLGWIDSMEIYDADTEMWSNGPNLSFKLWMPIAVLSKTKF